MDINVILGGALRKEAVEGPQQRVVSMAERATVAELIELLGLEANRVKIIILNGRGAMDDTPLADGDRIGLFPPELAYNTFVAVSFRKDRVASRQKE
jgi:molybdopterin converting factor small subunit